MNTLLKQPINASLHSFPLLHRLLLLQVGQLHAAGPGRDERDGPGHRHEPSHQVNGLYDILNMVNMNVTAPVTGTNLLTR